MPEEIDLRLARREPFAGDGLLGVLGARAVAGLERLGADGSYTRTVRLAGGAAVVTLWPARDGALGVAPPQDPAAPDGAGAVRCLLRLSHPGDRDDAVRLVRRLLDLDVDPHAVDAHLAGDPGLAPLVARRPGLRVLGTVDGFELALRAVIGQQISVAAARTVLGRIVLAHGEPVGAGLDPGPGPEVRPGTGFEVDPGVDPGPGHGIDGDPGSARGFGVGTGDGTDGGPLRLLPSAGTGSGTDGDPLRLLPSAGTGSGTDGGPLRLLPSAATIAALPDDALPMPRARAATVRRMAAAVADGELDLGPDADPPDAVAALLALPGIGPWTAGYVAMRALRDPDAFPATDLVLRRSAGVLGLPSDARGLAAHAARWSPWRAYAAQHLWAAAADPRA